MSDVEGRVFDLCVVGAGLVGSAAARHAALRGHSVCLIGPLEPKEPEEWMNREIFGSHYDEGRITRVWDSNEILRVLNKASAQRYGELQQQSGIKFHSPVGCLFMGHNATDMIKRFRSEKEDVNRWKSTNILDLSDRTTFQQKFSFLRCVPDESAYLETGDAGHVSPRRLVKAQQVAAELKGCQIVTEVAEEVCFAQLKENNILQVITESGTKICSRRVLLCTNAFTQFKPDLLPKDKGQLALRLRKTTAALIRIPEAEASRLSTMPSMIYRNKTGGDEPFHCYTLPPIKYPDGNWYLKIGLYTDEEEMSRDDLSLGDVKDWFISGGSKARTELCVDFMKDLVPGLQVDGMDSLCCVICYTPSKIPFIDFVTPELCVAVGGNGVSAKCSDELGRIAAVLATENVWSSSLDQTLFAVRWAETTQQ